MTEDEDDRATAAERRRSRIEQLEHDDRLLLEHYETQSGGDTTKRRELEGWRPTRRDLFAATRALGAIERAVARISAQQEQLDKYVEIAKVNGASWDQIGKAAGMTAQGAHRRWTETAKQRDRQAKSRMRAQARRAAPASRPSPPSQL